MNRGLFPWRNSISHSVPDCDEDEDFLNRTLFCGFGSVFVYLTSTSPLSEELSSCVDSGITIAGNLRLCLRR